MLDTSIRLKPAEATGRFNLKTKITKRMSKTNVKLNDHGTGADFINHQRAMDEAKNEKIKSEQGSEKIDPQQANRPDNRSRETDVSEKKSGAGKQSSPGD